MSEIQTFGNPDFRQCLKIQTGNQIVIERLKYLFGFQTLTVHTYMEFENIEKLAKQKLKTGNFNLH